MGKAGGKGGGKGSKGGGAAAPLSKKAQRAARKGGGAGAAAAPSKKAQRAARKAQRAAAEAARSQARERMMAPPSSEEDDEDDEEVVTDSLGNIVKRQKPKARRDHRDAAASTAPAAPAARRSASASLRAPSPPRTGPSAVEKAKAKAEKALAKALAKVAAGKKLSNKERRLVKNHEERSAADAEMLRREADPLDAFTLTVGGVATNAEESLLNDIHIPSFTIVAGRDTVLFDQATLKLASGRKYGVIGPNGHGKSCLLLHVKAGAAGGGFPIPKHIRVLYVEQEVRAEPGATAISAVLASDTRRAALLKEADELRRALEAAHDDDDDDDDSEDGAGDADTDAAWTQKSTRLAAVFDELDASGADAAESRARTILSGLGFSPAKQEQAWNLFSGGWQMRISLARALFLTPDLLLLDEPSNHLDLNAVLWLESYLQQMKSTTVLVVSHDRAFLDAVCTDILHVVQKKLVPYGPFHPEVAGEPAEAYSRFVDRADKQRAKRQKDFKQQTKRVEAILKANAGITRAEAEKRFLAEKASGGRKKTSGDDGAAALVQKEKDYVVRFEFTMPGEEAVVSGNSMSPSTGKQGRSKGGGAAADAKKWSAKRSGHGLRIELENVTFGYDDGAGSGGARLFEGVTLGVNTSTRAVLVGPNGAGKTTLIHLLTQTLAPSSGLVYVHPRLVVAHYHQHFETILQRQGLDAVGFLRSTHSTTEFEARRLLGRFGLPTVAHRVQISALSGGQKARLVWAHLTLLRPHILLLDEPTNHLDIESVDALVVGLRNYGGGVVVVSHDASLIERAGLELWVVADRGVVKHPKGFKAYRQEILDELEAEAAREQARAQARKRRRQAAREMLAASRRNGGGGGGGKKKLAASISKAVAEMAGAEEKDAEAERSAATQSTAEDRAAVAEMFKKKKKKRKQKTND